jgi:hypothetical protein
VCNGRTGFLDQAVQQLYLMPSGFTALPSGFVLLKDMIARLAGKRPHTRTHARAKMRVRDEIFR